jgi:hypothetical protein
MTEDEQRIVDVQGDLDLIADKIDRITDESDDEDAAFALRLIHAQGSALLHLLKKGQTDLEFRKIV